MSSIDMMTVIDNKVNLSEIEKVRDQINNSYSIKSVIQLYEGDIVK